MSERTHPKWEEKLYAAHAVAAFLLILSVALGPLMLGVMISPPDVQSDPGWHWALTVNAPLAWTLLGLVMPLVIDPWRRRKGTCTYPVSSSFLLAMSWPFVLVYLAATSRPVVGWFNGAHDRLEGKPAKKAREAKPQLALAMAVVEAETGLAIDISRNGEGFRWEVTCESRDSAGFSKGDVVLISDTNEAKRAGMKAGTWLVLPAQPSTDRGTVIVVNPSGQATAVPVWAIKAQPRAKLYNPATYRNDLERPVPTRRIASGEAVSFVEARDGAESARDAWAREQALFIDWKSRRDAYAELEG